MAIRLKRISPSLYLQRRGRNNLSMKDRKLTEQQQQTEQHGALIGTFESELKQACGRNWFYCCCLYSLVCGAPCCVLSWIRNTQDQFQDDVKENNDNKKKKKSYLLLYSFLNDWPDGADPVILVACTCWQRTGTNKWNAAGSIYTQGCTDTAFFSKYSMSTCISVLNDTEYLIRPSYMKELYLFLMFRTFLCPYIS